MKLVALEPLGIPTSRLEAFLRCKMGAQAQLILYDTGIEDPDTLLERGRDAEVLLLTNLPLPRRVIEGCPRLKLVCTVITGLNHIDLDACRERGIAVCNCPGYSTNAVAEMVFAMVLALNRKLFACDQAARSQRNQKGLMGVELEGKTFGIAGAGSIGLRVAKIAQVFGCRVICYSRTPKPETGLPFVDVETLLRESDILSLHLPLTSATQGFLSRERLEVMKPGAILINTARGELVDNVALAQQLQEGKLRGAGIDVLEVEPPFPPDHPLLSAPNVVLAPHTGFATKDALERRTRQLEENLSDWLEHGVPRYPA